MNYLDFFSSIQQLYQRSLLPICKEYSLSYMELTILLFLANNPEYDTAADIVRKRHLAKSHVSISIRSLEEKGLLRKEEREGNHRKSHLVLCDKSKTIVQSGQAAQNRFLGILSERISSEQKQVIINTIHIMNENVQTALRGKTL